VWGTGLAAALRETGVVFTQRDYLTPDGLVALGAMLGMDVTLEA
jgi:hypothetical protein